MEKYTKTLKNQNLDDLYLETLAWINSQQRKINSQQQKIVCISKNMLFLERIVV